MTQEKREQMKVQIAETAHHLFQAEGYAEVSMRRIAKEIGCAPMALYSYYDAKIDIVRTLWAGIFNVLFSELETNQKKRDPVQNLTALSTAYVNYWLEHTEHYRLVFMAEGVIQPDVSTFLDRPDIAQHYALFTNAISKASQCPLDQPQLKLKLDFLLCVLNGIAHNHITISGYPWSSPKDMVHLAMSGLLVK